MPENNKKRDGKEILHCRLFLARVVETLIENKFERITINDYDRVMPFRISSFLRKRSVKIWKKLLKSHTATSVRKGQL